MKKYCYIVGIALWAAQAASASGLVENKLVLPALPSWAQDGLYDGTYLDIDQVMKVEGLSRLQAVELQNQLKDRLAESASPVGACTEEGLRAACQAAYDSALARVRAGYLESGYGPVPFARPGDYVAVLDMDETLLQQWYASGAGGDFDLDGLLPDNNGGKLRSPRYAKFAPGAERAIRSLEQDPHNRGVIVFSAKLDAAALDLISKWRFADGTPARAHLAGVFTRNHLVLGPKMTIPSKDLRIFDADVKHVVMIDDNPARVAQPQALRAQPKFDADVRHAAAAGSAVALHYDLALDFAVAEVTESARAAEALSIPFAQAFLPYSYSGTRVYQSLARALGDESRALETTRLNPALQEAVFFSAP